MSEMDSVDAIKKRLTSRLTNAKKPLVCLTMIVKNESQIIERVLESLRDKINLISICDTGSTDNTAELIEQFGAKHNIPTKVHHEPFRHFAYNRTKSAQLARETFPNATWLLLSDADHIWEGTMPNTSLLTADQYLVEQYDSAMRYWNTRLIRASIDFECVCVTHEYWRVSRTHKLPIKRANLTSLCIFDKGDGGCKNDKLERDERLLTAALADPETEREHITRYRFYLGQTLQALGKYKESIDMYQQRVEDGGFAEEVYYSKFQIGRNWEHMAWKEDKNQEYFQKSKEAYLEAYKSRPTRAEALYALCKLHRRLSEHKECFDYALIGNEIAFPKEDILFIDQRCHDYLFDFELSIVAYYVGEKDLARMCLESLLEREDELPEGIISQCKHNAQFYI